MTLSTGTVARSEEYVVSRQLGAAQRDKRAEF